jgi:hypothetical protein
VLYQLSYSHHVPVGRGAPDEPRNDSHNPPGPVERVGQPIGRSAATWAATAFAASTSSPGPGTKIVRR